MQQYSTEKRSEEKTWSFPITWTTAPPGSEEARVIFTLSKSRIKHSNSNSVTNNNQRWHCAILRTRGKIYATGSTVCATVDKNYAAGSKL